MSERDKRERERRYFPFLASTVGLLSLPVSPCFVVVFVFVSAKGVEKDEERKRRKKEEKKKKKKKQNKEQEKERESTRKMARKKGAVMAIKLLSTAGTGFFYATKKNVKNVPEKLQLMKVRNVDIFSVVCLLCHWVELFVRSIYPFVLHFGGV